MNDDFDTHVEQYDKINRPHNTITKMEISPNGEYLVTYSEEDHSIVLWNVEDIETGRLKSGHTEIRIDEIIDKPVIINENKSEVVQTNDQESPTEIVTQ